MISAGVIGVTSAANGSSDRLHFKAWGYQPHAVPLVVPHIARSKTLVVRLESATSTYVDNLPADTSQGDELAVEGRLVSRTGAGVGRLEVREMVTGLGPDTGGRIQLTFTALLAGGQISGIGVTRFNTGTPAVAIVGGTGKYLGAHGEVFIHSGPHRTRLTFLLLPR
ncbi:MAG: hypothetical protein ABJB93_05550 [Gaiellales bacterium]